MVNKPKHSRGRATKYQSLQTVENVGQQIFQTLGFAYAPNRKEYATNL